MLRGCRTHKDAGASAGADEDEGADGAGTERPSSSCNHSTESSTCTDGAGAEKPTNSCSHSAEPSTGTDDGAGAEKPTNSQPFRGVVHWH